MQLIFDQENKLTKITPGELREIYYRTFSSKDAKIVLEDLASVSGIYRSNFVQNNSYYTSFLEGHRALFLYICSQLEDKTENIEGKTPC